MWERSSSTASACVTLPRHCGDIFRSQFMLSKKMAGIFGCMQCNEISQERLNKTGIVWWKEWWMGYTWFRTLWRLVHVHLPLPFTGTILVKSAKIRFTYLFGAKRFFSGVLLGENIINTLSGSCFKFAEKMAVCLCLYPQASNIKWLFIHMSGNKQSIYKWLSHVKPQSHIQDFYCPPW